MENLQTNKRGLSLYSGVKYQDSANAFLVIKMSFLNEIAGLCEKVGADVVEASRGIGTDTRIGMILLNAGIGSGGSCFPKDLPPFWNCKKIGCAMSIVPTTRKANRRARKVAVDKLRKLIFEI